MKNISKKEIKNLLTNLCCSKCKNDFDDESIEIVEKINDIHICKLHCKKCGADFGNILLKINNNNISAHAPLDIVDGPAPINIDDVINAHKYIKNNL